MRTIVIGDSAASNALGRALAMSLTAEELGSVDVYAVNDGPTWVGAAQLPAALRTFRALRWRELCSHLEQHESADTVIWLSKGTWPLNRIAARLRERFLVVADFDDDDMAIMNAFVTSSIVNRLKMFPGRRKEPRRLGRAQVETAAMAHGHTFSSAALQAVYRDRWRISPRPQAVIPHTRRPASAPAARPPVDHTLRIGFLGTMRAYKGADSLISLARSDVNVRIVTFKQDWVPPADVTDRWLELDPLTDLADAYASIDFLVLPMDTRSPAALHQLPAKLVDAAVNGCPVAASPTPPIMEFAGDSILPVEEWSDGPSIVAKLKAANRAELSAAMLRVYEQSFSPTRTSGDFGHLVGELRSGDEAHGDEFSASPSHSSPLSDPPRRRVRFVDLWVTPLSAREVAVRVTKRPSGVQLLLNHNLHSAFCYHTIPEFRSLYARAQAIIVDGWPILRLIRRSDGAPRRHSEYRIGSTDWLAELPAALEDRAERDQYRVFVLGADPKANALAVRSLKKTMPTADVEGRHGYFAQGDEPDVVAQIERFRPHLVLLGMGMPRQEEFLVRNERALPPAHYATVGGAIDYIAGQSRLGPRWLGAVGLEWLWRLTHEPGRLSRRYLIEPWVLTYVLIRNVAKDRLVRSGKRGPRG